MTIRDVQNDFGYKPPTASTREVVSSSIVGTAGTYLAGNSYDTGPYGASLTELTPNDTILTVGGLSYFVEQGAGNDLKLVVDWITAPAGTGNIQTQLVTSTFKDLADINNSGYRPPVMIDFGALPVAMFFQGYRQIMALPRSSAWQRYLGLQVITTGTMTQGSFVSWLGLNIDSVVQGYVSGVPIK